MIELTLKDNPTGLKVFVNEHINIQNIPSDKLQILAQSLECIIVKQYENYIKRKGEGKKNLKKLRKEMDAP